MRALMCSRGVVFAVVLVCTLPCFGAFVPFTVEKGGPTEESSLRFNALEDTANLDSAIPLTITAVKPNGAVDTAFNGTGRLYGVFTLQDQQQTFQDSFEGQVIDPKWVNPTFENYMEPHVGGAKGTLSSVRLVGNWNSFWDEYPYTRFPLAEIDRFTVYVRTEDIQSAVSRIGLMELDGGTFYTVATIAIGLASGDARVQLESRTGSLSNGPLMENGRWHKVDLVFDWNMNTVALWVDNLLIVPSFALDYGANNYGVSGIDIYNYNSGSVLLDEIIVVSNEAQYESTTTAQQSVVSDLVFQSGVWTGTAKISSNGFSGDGAVKLRAMSGSLSPSFSSGGLSTEFQITPGCLPGQFAPNYYSECLPCDPGSFSSTLGATECQLCPAGSYQPDAGSSSCELCTENYFNPFDGSTNSSSCLPCLDGDVSPPGSAQCGQCLPGQRVEGETECVDCPPGTYGTGVDCLLCPLGQYNDLPKQGECTGCPAGTSRGTFGATSILDCQNCPPGTFSYTGSSGCASCPSGTWSNQPAASQCSECPPGTFNDGIGSQSIEECSNCSAGSYSADPGAAQCTPCGLGYYSTLQGGIDCLACGSGTFGNETQGTECFDCAPGTYSFSSGQSICLPCSPGFQSTAVGAVGCEPCDPGYSSLGGSTECLSCGLGTFNNVSGSRECQQCPEGFSTLQRGSTSCSLKCGNALLDAGEFCDDGNIASGDGCSSECVVESGYICPGEPGEPCEENGAIDTSVWIGLAVAFGVALILCVIAGVILFIIQRRKPTPEVSVEMERHSAVTFESLRTSTQTPQSTGQTKIVLDPKYQKFQIPYGELDLTDAKVIGSGAFGYVYKVMWKGTTVAVKDIKSDVVSETELAAFMEEAEVMKKLKPHTNVVGFIGVVADPFCIISEYLEKGDLWTWLSKVDNVIPMKMKFGFIRDIVEGMTHLAASMLVHRDLAARNVLLDKNFVAKVSDFGLSRMIDTSNAVYSKSDIGPLVWMAPEALRKKKYSEKSDVWAFGVTCSEIMNRCEPYNGMDAVQVATAVVSEGVVPQLPADTPEAWLTIIKSCFEYEPEDRPAFKELRDRLAQISD